jgi:hypothetical protein
MTTAEEVNGATFAYGNWIMDNPYTSTTNPSFTFYNANYRSDGTHPANPTPEGSWDAEFRTITLYDRDNKVSTKSDNVAIVECQKNVIRWCGDGLLNTEY